MASMTTPRTNATATRFQYRLVSPTMRRSVPRARQSGGGSVPYQRSGQLQRSVGRVAEGPTYGRPRTIRDRGPANVLIHSKLRTGAYLEHIWPWIVTWTNGR